MSLTHRLAVSDDEPGLRALMAASIQHLQADFLSLEQVEASKAVMGLDRQLIADGAYFVVEDAGEMVGCGGWSKRRTLYGGDHSAGRDGALLNPMTESARIRAMYTHPGHARRGIGRLILSLCEDAARAAGFTSAELAGTLAGEPLYAASGYCVVERFWAATTPPVPLVRMTKPLD